MTPIPFLYPTLRVLMEDYTAPYQYPDATLLQGVTGMLLMNKLPGYSSPDGANITPDIVGANVNPCTGANLFALAIYQTVKLFYMPKPDLAAYGDRTVKTKYSGAAKRFLTHLELEIDALINCAKFDGWQSYHNWVAGMAGLPVGLTLTNVNVRAPFFTANVSTAGVTITPSSPAS